MCTNRSVRISLLCSKSHNCYLKKEIVVFIDNISLYLCIVISKKIVKFVAEN